MNCNDLQNLFGCASNCKEAGDLERANRAFLDTVRDRVPQGVVVVLKSDDDTKPADLAAWRRTCPHYFAVLVLELEGEVAQTIPVPVLEKIGGLELVDGLIAAAQYECTGWNNEDTDDENDIDDLTNNGFDADAWDAGTN